MHACGGNKDDIPAGTRRFHHPGCGSRQPHCTYKKRLVGMIPILVHYIFDGSVRHKIRINGEAVDVAEELQSTSKQHVDIGTPREVGDDAMSACASLNIPQLTYRLCLGSTDCEHKLQLQHRLSRVVWRFKT